MTRKTKTQHTGANAGMTFYPTIPQEVANKSFLKSLPTKNDAGNSHVETFVLATDSILKSGVRSFTFTDILRQCQRYGLEDALEVKSLFGKYCDFMERLGKVCCTPSVMDEDLFVIL